MNKDVVVIGAGGHGRVVKDIIIANNDNFIGFLDDNQSDFVIGKVNDYVKFRNCQFIIAVGNSKIREKFSDFNCDFYTAVHPSAIISPSAKIGIGSVVMPCAVVNSGAVIGKHCIINTASVVEHDNIISDFAHISVGAKLAGTVKIGKSTWIGVGASVINNISVCDNCMIGAGAVVVKNITESGTYIGVPAKRVLK